MNILIVDHVHAQSVKAELLSQETHIVIKNSKITRIHSYDICIYNRDGEEYTHIEIPYSGLIKVSNINAYIKDINGDILKKLNKSDIRERNSFPSFSFYQDEFVKEFTLKHNRYPYIIHYEFEEKEDEFILVDNWVPVLDVDIPTKSATLTIQVPKNYEINFSQQFIENPEKDSTNDDYILKWKANYDGNLKPEIYTPPITELLPTVVVVPINFKYEIKGSLKTWEDFGQWQNQLIKNIIDLPEEEISKVKNKTKGIEDQKDIIRTLYHYLQDETRYIDISIETGGLKPYPASYVAEKRYGDCKALSNYFRAILHAVNIDSYYSKIYADEKINNIDLSLPSQQTNHVILCVPSEKDTLWIDCTSDDAFGYVGTFIQGRKVFVVKDNASFFTHTQELSPSQVLQERDVILNYTLQGETFTTFSLIARGKDYEVLNHMNSAYNQSDKDEILRNYVSQNGFEPIEIKLHDPNRDSTNILLEYRAKSNDIYKNYGNDLLIKTLPFSIPDFQAVSDRKLPVQINYPIHKKDKLTYQLPENYRIEAKPDDKFINSKYGSYSVEYKISGNQVVVSKTLLINKGYYSLDEYPDFLAFIKGLIALDNNAYITTTKIN